MSSLTVSCLDTHPELLLIRPRVHRDERGFFAERWSERGFAELDLPAFVHENHSRSQRGTLRGMHYQAPPYAQGKLVSVVAGSIFDVSVDLRTQSPRYGRWDAAILDGSDPTWLWIPPGFAHGFLALSETADVVYKVSAPYAQEAEGGLAWDDPDVGIRWLLPDGEASLLSERDTRWPRLRELRSPFTS